jgi:hypothetical protein
MKKFLLGFLVVLSLGFVVQGGTEIYSGKDKEMKQVVPPPCPEWYRDTEWNVSIWGTYLFTGNDWDDDEYIQSDHGWGGGIDAKYFFHRYFGIGLEGWAVNAQRQRFLGVEFVPIPGDGTAFVDVFDHEDRFIGAVKGTFTVRYPIHCSRFAPYIWGGAGVIFGGGETDVLVVVPNGQVADIPAEHRDGDAEFLGQVGAGFEIRLTPHIGLINDFSWNFTSHDNSDFGMIRSGVNFAF